jgi:hypothetical protein
VSKTSGLTTTFTVDDKDGTGQAISNDVTSVQINTSRGSQDVTGLDKSAMERLLLLNDCTISINFVFNSAATTGVHTVLSTITDNDTRTVVIVFPGTVTLTAECVLTAYNINRAQDGSLTGTAEFALANGTAATWS